jgi:hypothetical protein
MFRDRNDHDRDRRDVQVVFELAIVVCGGSVSRVEDAKLKLEVGAWLPPTSVVHGFVPRVSGHRWMMLGGERNHPTTFRSGVTVAADIRTRVCSIKYHVWYRKEHLMVV